MKTRRPAATVAFAMIIVLAFITFLIFYAFDREKEVCDYSGEKYVGKSLDECSRIKFVCVAGTEYFSDDCGCGCRPVETEKRNYCTNESRESDVCAQIYQPVCGWFSEKIQCIKYPCAVDFGNSCEACGNEDVSYWTSGVCPEE